MFSANFSGFIILPQKVSYMNSSSRKMQISSKLFGILNDPLIALIFYEKKIKKVYMCMCVCVCEWRSSLKICYEKSIRRHSKLAYIFKAIGTKRERDWSFFSLKILEFFPNFAQTFKRPPF